jgi:hypothetical protein
MSFGASLPLYKIVSKTVTVTESGAQTNANTTFNTNVPFGKAMLIRRLRWIIATKTALLQSAQTVDQLIGELTEDPTKTVVAQTDPFALDTFFLEYDSSFSTAASASNIIRDGQLYRSFVLPDPGVPTVAQQLNVVVSALRVVGASVYSWDTFCEIYYELIDLSENLRTFLSNRIVLTRTT